MRQYDSSRTIRVNKLIRVSACQDVRIAAFIADLEAEIANAASHVERCNPKLFPAVCVILCAATECAGDYRFVLRAPSPSHPNYQGQENNHA